MFPVYQGMNSYPYQRNQMPSTQYYHPSCEAVPPQMKEDPSSSSCTHEPWPHNFGYPVPPMQCHNCCMHVQHPAYYNFRPPCSHLPPPPPPAYNHFCGGYPPYPQSYPMCYVPPPHYSVELPRYEFDKNEPRDQFHCCGCSNKSSHVKGRNNVKIEEHEPDVETKQSESLFPSGPNNFSYPIMWFPPGFTLNKEQQRKLVENEGNKQQVLPYVKKPQAQRKSIDREARDNDGSPLGVKPHQSARSVEEDPNLSYGWFPLDMNSIKQLMGGARNTHDQDNRSRDEKKACEAENKDQNKQWSYPIIWMPYDRLLKDHSKGQVEKAGGGTSAEEPPSSSDVVLRKMERTDNEEGTRSTVAGDDDSNNGTLGAEKKTIVKTIPVKQLDESAPKLSKNEEEHKVDGAHVEKVKPSSPTKKSKLPPICLRVDPPKKKSGNGSSRSPSPPGDKKRQDSEESNSRGNNKQHKEIKVKDAEDKTPNQNKIEVSHGAGEAGSAEVKKVVQQADNDKTDNAKREHESGQAPELQAAKESKSQPESKQERKVLSEMDAAVRIQSAYRGHDVRRWEPLKKLKQIAKVREEVMQVKKKIEDLESRHAIDDKEKAIIGETIMKLLLRLDTIQGMHQSIRDVRRPVAKELIILQEKLDSITSQKSTLLCDDTSTAQAADETHKDYGLVEGSENIVEKALEPSEALNLDGDKIAKASEGEGISSNDFDFCSSQLRPCQSVVSGSENKETSEPLLVDMDSRREPQDNIEVSDSSASIDGDAKLAGLGLEMKEKELDASEIDLERSPFEESVVDSSPIEETPAQNDLVIENKGANLLSELPEEVVEKSEATAGPVENISEQNDLVSGDKDEESLPLEPPEEVVEKSVSTAGPVENILEQNDLVSVDKSEESQPLGLTQEADVGLLANASFLENSEVQTDMVAGDEDQKTDILCELPGEVVEEDEKEKLRTEHDLGSSELCSSEDKPHDDANDDGEELAEVEHSENLNKDLELSQPSETLEADDENFVIIEYENYDPLKLSSQKAEISQESESVINTTNTNIEIPVIGEGENKLQGSIGGEEAAEVEVVEIAPPKENEDEVTKKIQETNTMECSSKTAVLTGHLSDHENVTEPLTGDQEYESETLKQELTIPEPEVQQSEKEYEACGKSMEDESSVVVAENEVQVDKKILDENERLRELLEKLLAAGKEQQEVISSLNGKVKDLEKKLAKKKKPKSAKHLRVKVPSHSCRKPANGLLRERPMGIAS